jgi:hypothetical protein
MPVEHLWQWLREDVTYHTCYDHKHQLIQQVTYFVNRLKLNPLAISGSASAAASSTPLGQKSSRTQ